MWVTWPWRVFYTPVYLTDFKIACCSITPRIIQIYFYKFGYFTELSVILTACRACALSPLPAWLSVLPTSKQYRWLLRWKVGWVTYCNAMTPSQLCNIYEWHSLSQLGDIRCPAHVTHVGTQLRDIRWNHCNCCSPMRCALSHDSVFQCDVWWHRLRYSFARICFRRLTWQYVKRSLTSGVMSFTCVCGPPFDMASRCVVVCSSL